VREDDVDALVHQRQDVSAADEVRDVRRRRVRTQRFERVDRDVDRQYLTVWANTLSGAPRQQPGSDADVRNLVTGTNARTVENAVVQRLAQRRKNVKSL
jgi:hypothetical protein